MQFQSVTAEQFMLRSKSNASEFVFAEISSAGIATLTGISALLVPNGTLAAPALAFSSETGTGIYKPAAATWGVNVNGARALTVTATSLLVEGGTLGFPSSPGNALDVILTRAAANVLALQNGTSAQTFQVYGTTTGPKYLSIDHNGTDGEISTVGGDILLLPASNVVSVKNSTVAQKLRVYGTTTGPKYITLGHDGGNPYLIAIDDSALLLGTNNQTRWSVQPSTQAYSFAPSSDNAYDIGLSNTRPRTVYVGTSLLVSGSSGSVGIGYGTGAGGIVTQGSNKTTGVTLNTATGQVTMNGAALGAGTIATFILTNNMIAVNDILILNHIGGGVTPGGYTLNARCSAGSAQIDVRNNTAGSLSEAIIISFAIFKAVVA